MKDPRAVKKPYAGVDPGPRSGGIALISPSGKCVEAWPMPETQSEVIILFEDLFPQIEFAVVEKVNAMPKQGVVSVWNFSGNYHTILTILKTLKIPMEEVRPVAWKRKIGGLIASKSDKKTKKALSRDKALSLFPNCYCHNKRNRIGNDVADAILIAEYGRRLRKGL